MSLTVADRLRFFMDRAGLTQTQLASRVRKSPSAISHWLSDRFEPTYDNLELACEAMDIDLATFFGPLKPRRGRR